MLQKKVTRDEYNLKAVSLLQMDARPINVLIASDHSLKISQNGGKRNSDPCRVHLCCSAAVLLVSIKSRWLSVTRNTPISPEITSGYYTLAKTLGFLNKKYHLSMQILQSDQVTRK